MIRRAVTAVHDWLLNVRYLSEREADPTLCVVPGVAPEVCDRVLDVICEAFLIPDGQKYCLRPTDQLMAIYKSVKGDQPKHVTLACYAALENQERLESLREELKADGYPEIRCRIGLNSGPMVVGNMGSENRMDYTVMGDAVNLGSRLEGASKQYGTRILIGENTFSLATNDIEVREIDLIRVKGIRQPVRVYELLAKKGELPPEKVRLVGVYVKGLAQYRERNWRDAIRCFQEALEINPQDGPARVYVERCETFIENPPPLDWDGVYEMKTK